MNSFSTAVLVSLCMQAQSLQLCLTLSDPMDYSPPGSSVGWFFWSGPGSLMHL